MRSSYSYVDFLRLTVFNQSPQKNLTPFLVKDLRKHLELGNGFTEESDQINWLFEILEEYDQEKRALFL